MRKDDRKIEDDGRSFADMSSVDIPTPFGFIKASKLRKSKDSNDSASADNSTLSRKDRRAFILGALAAALLIGLVFALGLGLAILCMTLFW